MDEIIFATVDKLFARNSSIPPSQIDILVVNVFMHVLPCTFSTSRILNRYKMREDIKTFNLALWNGLQCNTESMAPNRYCGKEKSMMLTNCLFRAGGCSMLFTNRRSLQHLAMLKLKWLVRTHIGPSDKAYECCIQLEDESGHLGFRLTKHVTEAAALAFTVNLQVLVPKVLPLTEIIRYLVASRLQKKKTAVPNAKI
ncbi:putative very-long-chain 3-oxoacyl-CoA synthase [Rosa chinensis]|uniref:Putative very-long-chain 3-oxoacyl-CoA synthase n=1 Tax=Rosa chinensis TaxID=74649 RepID=A0A2P6SJZ3_ROSCH|nr:putative very-long-chain 3-oxoacyl-CoA synthase [Rosa chinensis]